METQTLVKYLDLANHHQQATPTDIQNLCQEVLTYGFNSAFVNPFYVAFAKEKLEGRAKVGTVVAFPLGQELLTIKLASAVSSIENGADELDVSLNVAYFKTGNFTESLEEAKAIVRESKAKRKEIIVKFIIETGCLTEDEIKRASEIVLESGADFVKTCSGIGPRGATLRDVELIREAIGDRIKVKVAGGIDTLQEALDFIEKGVDRIGTSAAVKIIQEASK
ncbi:MAG: deoxyribose-phosphate aldolase [bacterium]|nr:deoxyribose-phosphate aldolase [bacterium]